MTRAQEVIGQLRGEIRKFVCRQMTAEHLGQLFQGAGLDIQLTPQGYQFRVPMPGPAGAATPPLTPTQEESVAGLPKLYAVDPPQRTAEAILITGADVECLPGILTELSSVGLMFQD